MGWNICSKGKEPIQSSTSDENQCSLERWTDLLGDNHILLHRCDESYYDCQLYGFLDSLRHALFGSAFSWQYHSIYCTAEAKSRNGKTYYGNYSRELYQ